MSSENSGRLSQVSACEVQDKWAGYDGHLDYEQFVVRSDELGNVKSEHFRHCGMPQALINRKLPIVKLSRIEDLYGGFPLFMIVFRYVYGTVNSEAKTRREY